MPATVRGVKQQAFGPFSVMARSLAASALVDPRLLHGGQPESGKGQQDSLQRSCMKKPTTSINQKRRRGKVEIGGDAGNAGDQASWANSTVGVPISNLGQGVLTNFEWARPHRWTSKLGRRRRLRRPL